MDRPDHMNQDAVGKYDDLWKRQGKDFDSRYIGDEISKNQNYVSLFEKEADQGNDRQLMTYAQSLLPTIAGARRFGKADRPQGRHLILPSSGGTGALGFSARYLRDSAARF
jgi:predicted outer membrane protein